MKGIDGVVPAVLLEALHAHAEIILGLAYGLEQYAVGRHGRVKGLGVGIARGLLQLRQAGLRGGERDQLLLERSHRIGPAQQCAGAAAQGSELLHFAVIGQDQQDGHGQQAGMQTQNGAELFTVHIRQFLAANDDVRLEALAVRGQARQNAGRLDARGHDPDPGHARVAQGASVQSGESLAFAEQKNAGQAAVSAGHGVFLAYTKGHGAASAAVAFTLYI